VLRIVGASGVGKTFVARAYGALTGRTFSANPINQSTDIGEFIGFYEEDENGILRFNAQTAFRTVLENGGVVALSEMNAHVDDNDKVSLAWWLQQLVEAPRQADGTRKIYLTEVPSMPASEDAVHGRSELDAIIVHPDALIVIDTNPEKDYGERGAFQQIFKENTPSLHVEDFVMREDTSDTPEETQEKNLAKIKMHLEHFLHGAWVERGQTIAEGVSALLEKQEDDLPTGMAGVFNDYVQAHLSGKLGAQENIIFTKRELKRFAEDVQYHYGVLKLPAEEAVAQAVYTSFILRWRPEQCRHDNAI